MAARKEQSESGTKASVNLEELRELIALLRDNGLAELELEREDFRVRLRREGVSVSSDHGQYVPVPAPVSDSAPSANPASAPPAPPGAHATAAASEDQNLHIIPSPIVGTFYRSPSPSAEPFVKIGASVEPQTVVCIIEAMKLMNEIQAEASGEVVKIYVENGQPVEYGQPLFGIKS
ncbi:MAG TPA: acetyl-CoA carboxylase biotin carboxyl carrier protein [Pyrinomonadaceae bacterium]|jgi:acetyl-CoA carboxylase biotin carboxyl carrier protein|nr:acetyl-CoA carboxylase biotin carboxyl carrier protein [Pyrinomonadaceae bacterium]